MRYLIVLALAAPLLTACANTDPPLVSGPVRQLNAGKWTATSNDLRSAEAGR